MADVQVRIKNGPTSTIVLDRVPVKGEYIAGTSSLFQVDAVVFTPGDGTIDAVLFAAKDADGTPDEISGFVLPHL